MGMWAPWLMMLIPMFFMRSFFYGRKEKLDSGRD